MRWEIAFTIGPVQGYVTQSRRTRDLWGSSYLLSYLAARAMCGAEDAGGTIVRPRMGDDPLYQWVKGSGAGQPPRIGSIPNHFVVTTDADPRAVAAAATEAFHAAWRRVREAVWQRFVGPVADEYGNGTRAIWDRQVESCWELAWVAGRAGESGDLIARRKQWRTYRLPDEPGDKCTVMPDFQELSGHVRSNRGAEAQKGFWTAVRGRAGRTELRAEDDERLCAPAIVKRLFPKCGQQAIGGELDVTRWPSTLYIGAVPWLREVSERAGEQAGEYVIALRKAAEADVVRHRVPVVGLRDAQPNEFFKLDANFYYRPALASPRRCPLRDDDKDGNHVKDSKARPELMALLEKLCRAAGSAPPVYYALLLADGDQVGRLAADAGPDVVSAALSAFGHRVEGIVEGHDGVTVYAGGDDVLAMLPVAGALDCADQLAAAYTEAFEGQSKRPATLSAAVLFAHARAPIGGALDRAHRLLDEVAKESNGHDSLAAAVLKPGGSHCQWVTSWIRAYPDGRTVRAVNQIAELTRVMADEGGGRGFSASLLHHARDLLEILAGLRRWKPGKTGALPPGLGLRDFVHAELADSWAHRNDMEEPGPADLVALTNLVADLLPPSLGRREDGTTTGVDGRHAGMDALLLARFLAGGGREDEHA